MEARLCLSAFYDYDIIAKTGSGLTSIQPAASINDSGDVAFVAITSAGQSVYFVDGSSAPQIVSFPNPNSTRTYGQEVQINNAGQLAAIDITNVGSQRLARIWDSNNPGSNTIIGRSSAPRLDTTHFDGLGGFASIANDGKLAFAGLESPTPPSPAFWEVQLSSTFVDRRDFVNPLTDVSQLDIPPSPFFRQMAADGERVVVGNRQGTTNEITWYDITGPDSSEVIASTSAGWAQLGIRPGISDDGTVVVFYGAKSDGSGLGLYARVWDGSIFSEPILLAGANLTAPRAELGYNDSVNPIYFKSDRFDIDSRPSITYLVGGPVGLESDSFVVSFIGTPSEASRLNTNVAGTPLLFSANKGVWAIRVDLSKPAIPGDPDQIEYSPASAFPVIQIGDKLDTGTVNSVAIHDSIAAATVDKTGAARTPQRGDHVISFWADTTAGQIIARAWRLDTDQDGLLDHWETSGKGIDINLDGMIDLDLYALGARPNQRDLFLEIDWLRPESGQDFAPQPTALQTVVSTFAAQGINLHVDAGARSVNYPTGIVRQGGDLITTNGSHIDVVYFSVVNVPAGTVTRSFDSIKKSFFGTKDKAARELAFHYVIFADNHTDFQGSSGLAEIGWQGPLEQFLGDSNGNGMADPGEFTDSNGNGDYDYLNMNTIPGNDVIVSLQGSTQSPRLKIPGTPPVEPFTDTNGNLMFDPGEPFNDTNGNGIYEDYSINTPLGYFQSQTLMHELGHNLGLMHGGVDNITAVTNLKRNYADKNSAGLGSWSS